MENLLWNNVNSIHNRGRSVEFFFKLFFKHSFVHIMLSRLLFPSSCTFVNSFVHTCSFGCSTAPHPPPPTPLHYTSQPQSKFDVPCVREGDPLPPHTNNPYGTPLMTIYNHRYVNTRPSLES